MVGGASTHLSEGGGNSMPFELLGGDYIDPDRFAADMNAQGIEGLYFRPVTFKAKTGVHRGELLHGVHLMVTDARAVRPLRAALAMLTVLQKNHGKQLVVSNERKFGRVWGNDDVLLQVRKGQDWRSIEAGWEPALREFAERRAKHLIYEEGDVPTTMARGPASSPAGASPVPVGAP
jgi:beta-N-acetylhexosaminidase